jgi:hypothetical protein
VPKEHKSLLVLSPQRTGVPPKLYRCDLVSEGAVFFVIVGHDLNEARRSAHLSADYTESSATSASLIQLE